MPNSQMTTLVGGKTGRICCRSSEKPPREKKIGNAERKAKLGLKGEEGDKVIQAFWKLRAQEGKGESSSPQAGSGGRGVTQCRTHQRRYEGEGTGIAW